ncbi:MAG: hypothetical protein AB7F88_15205 [Pyrinomonadaceae bacterium]
MRKLNLLLSAFFISMIVAAGIAGQEPTGIVRNTVISGEVVTVSGDQVVVKTAAAQVVVSLSASTEYKRVPPENPVLKAAVPAALADIGVGDKLLVSGKMSDDKTSLAAKSVYLMTKSDIAGRHAKEKERWAARGISGRVTAVDQDAKQITLEVRGLAAATSVVLTPKEQAKFLRYAPDSIDYNEAVPSRLADIAEGDMLRAVGDKSADGASFAAEEIVTGAFQTHAGTVKSLDVEKNEVVITELQSNKDVTIVLAKTSVMKKFPAQMAQMMAMRQAAGGARAEGQGSAQARPMGAAGQGRPGGGTRGGIDDMLERFPNISAADLKVGDMIAVSSTKTTSLDRITAIKLLAGVEPFIRAAQTSRGGQRRGQGSQSLDIPGLGGFDEP